MPGIKLHHETLRNCTVAVECQRGYRAPYNCPLCNVTHNYKTVHLNLDNEGDVIVSTGVWNTDLKDHPNLPFIYADDVKKPPALIIGMNGDGGQQAARDILAHPYEGRR
jgi:hypothetical protein